MSDLKTLKDIELKFPINFMKCRWLWYSDFDYLKEELKAEAVKWVKELENIRINHNIRGISPLTTDWNKILEGRIETIEFIKHFFNLTEEDLK